MSAFVVTNKALRPASKLYACFYCKQPVGDTHLDDCALIKRKVRVRLTLEYDVSEPASWKPDMIEFHRNDGSWCASNLLGELEELDERNQCLCMAGARFAFVGYAGEPELSES